MLIGSWRAPQERGKIDLHVQIEADIGRVETHVIGHDAAGSRKLAGQQTTQRRGAERADVGALAGRSSALCDRRPLYPGFRGYTTYVA